LRIANLSGRLRIITGYPGAPGGIDVAAASDGQFSPDPAAIYPRWAEFTAWARRTVLPDPGRFAAVPVELTALGSPSPEPRQVYGIGLNYADHVAESGFDAPKSAPPVFTKFPSCITGPADDITLVDGGHNDWEVELVVIIGTTAARVPASEAWDYVAGLAAGQDISERILQFGAAPPQFSLGKSYPGFGPVGPWLVTPDEFADPDDLELGCSIDGEPMQKGRTKDMIFGVSELIGQLSAVTPLVPGDLIFTGTPSGVGLGRNPQRWLQPGEVLTSYIEGIGEMRHRFVAAR
jgi:2,4-didehydro-3-deoxy-L-rhamnonate hydrolase